MFNLTDILMQVQGGEAVNNLARQFGLRPAETKTVVEAMMPVFAEALRRQMTDPQAMQTLIKLMTGGSAGGQADPFRDAMALFAPRPADPAAELFGTLVGANPFAQAIAAQVAGLAGINPSVSSAMLPVVASLLMEALTRQVQQSPLAKSLPELARAFASGDAGQYAAALTKAMQAMPNPAGPNSPFDETFGAFVRGFNRGRPEPAPKAPLDELSALFGQMFEAGASVQASHNKAIADIFDQFAGKAASRS